MAAPNLANFSTDQLYTVKKDLEQRLARFQAMVPASLWCSCERNARNGLQYDVR